MRSLWLLTLLPACASMPLYPSRPGALTGAPHADPLPSKVVVHLTATSDGLRKALDSRVPKSGETTFELRGPRAVAWSRGPFTLRFADGRIEMKTDLALEVDLPVLGKQNVPVAVTGTVVPRVAPPGVSVVTVGGTATPTVAVRNRSIGVTSVPGLGCRR